MKISPSQTKALRQMSKNPRFWFGFITLLIVCFVGLFATEMAPYDLDEMDLAMRLMPPSTDHWLGNDLNGGDVLTSIIYGTKISLYVGFATVALSLILGVTLGLVSGFFGGWIDTIIMRCVDLIMAFPGILLAMSLTALMGPSLNNVILAIAATGWTSSARLIRGQVLSIREREYVQATRALGAKNFRMIFYHIFPETLSPLMVLGTFSLSGVIIIEASLSFLGLGAQDEAPSWGMLLGQGRTVLETAPHLSIAPGLTIFILVLALNFLGDALRDALDPKFDANH